MDFHTAMARSNTSNNMIATTSTTSSTVQHSARQRGHSIYFRDFFFVVHALEQHPLTPYSSSLVFLVQFTRFALLQCDTRARLDGGALFSEDSCFRSHRVDFCIPDNLPVVKLRSILDYNYEQLQ